MERKIFPENQNLKQGMGQSIEDKKGESMREIKFRFGWNVLKDVTAVEWDGPREWVFEIYTLEELVGGAVPPGEAFSSYKTRDEYTGLKDKNGKEIYEGDLIKNEFGRICEVIWHEYMGCWDAKVRKYRAESKGGHLGFQNNEWPRHVMVIGNIYENSELLKEEKI